MNCAWRAKKLATVLKDSLNSQNKSASRHSGPLKVAAAPTFHWKLKRRVNKNIQRWTKSLRRLPKPSEQCSILQNPPIACPKRTLAVVAQSISPHARKVPSVPRPCPGRSSPSGCRLLWPTHIVATRESQPPSTERGDCHSYQAVMTRAEHLAASKLSVGDLSKRWRPWRPPAKRQLKKELHLN
jgi:hypothetical protein